MITETSARGTETVRGRWLETSLTAIKRLRERGIPVVGYTWFPMFTMINWQYRLGRLPLERYRLDLGLYRLKENPDGSRWNATPLVRQWRQYVDDPARSVGALRKR